MGSSGGKGKEGRLVEGKERAFNRDRLSSPLFSGFLGLRLRLRLRLWLRFCVLLIVLRRSLLPLGVCSSRICFSMSSKVSSASGSHLRSLGHRSRTNSQGCVGGGDVGAGHTETVNIVSDVVDGLNNAVGVDILVVSTSHAKSILGLCLG